MNKKYGFCVLALAGALTFSPIPAFSGNLEHFSDALSNLADMTSAADRAYDALKNARDDDAYSRYDRDWRNAESRLERERVRTMAHIAGVSEARIRSLRNDGYGWERIAQKYHIDPGRFGYGHSRYDRERDKWKGVPPGLAKKGGMPPGQMKKEHASPHAPGGMPRGQAKKADRHDKD